MKKAGWFVSLIIGVLIVVQIIIWHNQHAMQRRASFLALPQSVVLEQNEKKNEPPSQAPQLAGLTADDLVRGMLSLAKADQSTFTPAQARSLLPVIRGINEQRYRLLTLRNDRHAANEASMEDTLALARFLTNEQLQRLVAPLANVAPQAATDRNWVDLLSKLEINRQQ